MKANSLVDNIKTALLTIVLIVVVGLIDALPWWSFIVPVVMLGMVTSYLRWKVSGFLLGFSIGFILWIAFNLFFDVTVGRGLLDQISSVLGYSSVLVLLIAGLTGGILTGLSLHAGKHMIKVSAVS
jgi:hypothetical protein